MDFANLLWTFLFWAVVGYVLSTIYLRVRAGWWVFDWADRLEARIRRVFR